MVRYKKDDVEFHSDGYRPGHPAVNVKVYKTIDSVELPFCEGGMVAGDAPAGTPIKWEYSDPEFTHEWIEEHVSEDELYEWWDVACQDNWEMVEDDCEEIFGVKCYQEGRSGGWAVPDGIEDFDSWDAIMLARWRKFERAAKMYADDVPYATVNNIYYNVFLPWKEQRNDEQRALGATIFI